MRREGERERLFLDRLRTIRSQETFFKTLTLKELAMFLIFLYIKVANLVNYDVVACYPVQAAAFLIDVKY